MPKVNKDNSNLFFDYNVHFETRMIHIGAPDQYSDTGDHGVTFQTASDVIKAVLMLEGSGAGPIQINIMTYGGSYHAAMAIYDVLVASRCVIAIRGMGPVMSAGSIIMQGATPGYRQMYPNSTLMLHDGEDGFYGQARDFEVWADVAKKSRNAVYHLFAEKSGKRADFFRKKMDRDWILSPEQALEVGLIDEIIDKNYV